MKFLFNSGPQVGGHIEGSPEEAARYLAALDEDVRTAQAALRIMARLKRQMDHYREVPTNDFPKSEEFTFVVERPSGHAKYQLRIIVFGKESTEPFSVYLEGKKGVDERLWFVDNEGFKKDYYTQKGHELWIVQHLDVLTQRLMRRLKDAAKAAV